MEEWNHHPHTLPVRGSSRRWRALVIRAAPRTPLSQSGGFMRLGSRDVPGGEGRGTLPAEPSFTAEDRTFHQGLATSCMAGLVLPAPGLCVLPACDFLSASNSPSCFSRFREPRRTRLCLLPGSKPGSMLVTEEAPTPPAPGK